jgi:hypothetical protein
MSPPRVRIRTLLLAVAALTLLTHFVLVPTWRYLRLPPKTRAVLSLLDRPVQFPAPGPMPLSDLLKWLKLASQSPGKPGVPIYVDPKGLEDAGATVADEVKVTSDRVPFKTVLREALGPKGLGFYVEDGLLTVTSEAAAARALQTRPEKVRRP